MKTLVRLVLLLFVFFLAAPTIVSVVKKSSDTTCVWNMSEEELSHKEVKAQVDGFCFHVPLIIEEFAAPVAGHPQTFADSYSAQILIPPPEQV